MQMGKVEKNEKILNLKLLKDGMMKKLGNYYHIWTIIMKNFTKERKLPYIKQFLLKLLKQRPVTALKVEFRVY